MANFLAFIAALGAGIAAIAALRTAKETRKIVLAQIINDIRDQFSTKQIDECINALKRYKNLHEDIDAEFRSGLALIEQRNMEVPEIEIDNYRRMYSYIFHKLAILLDGKCIDNGFIKKIIYPDEIDILLNIVEPLEKAKARFLNKDYNPKTFDTFRKLFR